MRFNQPESAANKDRFGKLNRVGEMKAHRPDRELIVYTIGGCGVDQVRRADHGSVVELRRDDDSERFAQSKTSTHRVARLAGVDQERATVGCVPRAILESLVTADNEPRPRLMDSDQTHERTSAKRENKQH